MKRNRGITLIALIITIIVLLILVGVTISLVLGDNGILNRAKTSGEEYTKASIKEEIELGIADIAAEFASKNPTEGLTKEAIVNHLSNRVGEDLIIQDDLTGEYRGYNYWIDDNYVVHIGDRVNSNFKVSINVTKIGTTYFTTTVTANSTQGEIVGYKYSIDGVETQQITNNVYTVENLEPESKHTIKAIAIDDQGNKKETRTVSIKTQARTYLYNQGTENQEKTGGWETNTYSYRTGYTVVAPEKKVDSVSLNATADRRAVAFGTKNKIDITEYKYLKCEINIDKTTRYVHLMLTNNKTNCFDNRALNVGYASVGPQNGYLITLDVSGFNQEAYIAVCNQGIDNVYGRFHLTKVWLEK